MVDAEETSNAEVKMTVTLSSNILKEILIITFIVTIMMVIKRMGGAIDTRTP